MNDLGIRLSFIILFLVTLISYSCAGNAPSNNGNTNSSTRNRNAPITAIREAENRRPLNRAHTRFLRHRRLALEREFNVMGPGSYGNCPCVTSLLYCRKPHEGIERCLCVRCHEDRRQVEGNTGPIGKHARRMRDRIGADIGRECLDLQQEREREIDRENQLQQQPQEADEDEIDPQPDRIEPVIQEQDPEPEPEPEHFIQDVMQDEQGNDVVDVGDYRCNSFNSRYSDEQAYISDAFRDSTFNDDHDEELAFHESSFPELMGPSSSRALSRVSSSNQTRRL